MAPSVPSLVQIVKTSMYTLIKVESSMPILMSRTYLLIGTTKYVQQEQTRLIKTDLSNAPTDQLVIMSVLSLKVLLLISNSGRTPSFTIFISPMCLLLLSKTPLESFKQQERRRTLPTFAPLAVVSGSVLQANAKPSLNPTHRRLHFLDLFHTLLKTVFGTIVRQATLVKPIMCDLMRV